MSAKKKRVTAIPPELRKLQMRHQAQWSSEAQQELHSLDNSERIWFDETESVYCIQYRGSDMYKYDLNRKVWY